MDLNSPSLYSPTVVNLSARRGLHRRRRRHFVCGGRRHGLAAVLGSAGAGCSRELADCGPRAPEQPVHGAAGLVVAQQVLEVEEFAGDVERQPHPPVSRAARGVDLAVPVLLHCRRRRSGGGSVLGGGRVCVSVEGLVVVEVVEEVIEVWDVVVLEVHMRRVGEGKEEIRVLL